MAGSSYGSGSLAGTDRDVERLSSSVSANIKKLAQNVNSYQRMVDRIGTPQDVHDLTSQLKDLQHSTKNLSDQTKEQLSHLVKAVNSSLASLKKQRDMTRKRLFDEFSNIMLKFQKAQREAVDKERESVRRARANSASSSNPFADTDTYSGGQDDILTFENEGRKTSMQAVLEEEENLAAIEEREKAIRDLEADIVGVNEIFTDLGKLVYDQGETIDSIEGNIENASGHVEQANTQLTIARNYQSATRKKKCVCFAILIAAALVIAIIITISVVTKQKSN